MDIEKEKARVSTILAKAKRYFDSHETEEDILITTNHGCTQYYAIGVNGKRRYISKKDTKTLTRLLKRSYAKKLVQFIPEELNRINLFQKQYNAGITEKIYESFPEETRCLLEPYEQTDEQFAQQWAKQAYKTKGINPGETCYTTDNGEKVRSKSELTIANKLHSKAIKYRYEQPLYLKGYGTVYPDFTILNPHTREEMYLEHFGMMSNPDYVDSTLRKLNTYAINGIFPGKELVITYESESNPLDTSVLDCIFDNLFK